MNLNEHVTKISSLFSLCLWIYVLYKIKKNKNSYTKLSIIRDAISRNKRGKKKKKRKKTNITHLIEMKYEVTHRLQGKRRRRIILIFSWLAQVTFKVESVSFRIFACRVLPFFIRRMLA